MTHSGGQVARIHRTRSDIAEAALAILVSEGVLALTHARVAAAAGYARRTLYSHWPARVDPMIIALDALTDMPHGPDRHDRLVGELRAFRQALVDRHLDAIVMVAAQWGADIAEIATVRDRIAAHWPTSSPKRAVRDRFWPALDAAVHMLTGAVICPILMCDTPPDDRSIDAAVDMVLTGLAHH